VSGVAVFCRIAEARSPGRISVPTKMRTEAANSVRRPRANRLRTSFSTATSFPPRQGSPARSAWPGWLPGGGIKGREGSRPRVPAGPKRSFDPGFLHDPAVVHVEAAVRRVATNLLAMPVEPVAEDGNERAAAFVEDRLHLPDMGLALGLVRLGARVGEQLLKLRVIPVRLVPGRAGLEGDREHLRRRRPSAPVAADERTLQPHIVEETVGRLLLQVDLDAGLGGARLEQRALIDRSVERCVRDLQQDLRVGNARLLEVEVGLLRIVFALW